MRQSDGTVVFDNVMGGTKLTLDTCIRESKRYPANPIAEQLRAWLVEHQIKIRNVADNRSNSLTPDQLE